MLHFLLKVAIFNLKRFLKEKKEKFFSLKKHWGKLNIKIAVGNGGKFHRRLSLKNLLKKVLKKVLNSNLLKKVLF